MIFIEFDDPEIGAVLRILGTIIGTTSAIGPDY